MFSIIIPTMQINKKNFYMLLDELVADEYIKEIIVIDNSLQGVNYQSDKLKVITPNENIYVNPAWNLGVENAGCEYIGILNDDLLFPRSFFKQVYDFLINKDNIGYIGLQTIPKTEISDSISYPQDTKLLFEISKRRTLSWGSAIFCKKTNYDKIPDDLKVWYGDDYLFEQGIKNKRTNFAIANSNIMHLHSLTSSRKEFDEIKHQDQLAYQKLYPQYIVDDGNLQTSFIQKIFSIRKRMINCVKYQIIYILGIKLSIRK